MGTLKVSASNPIPVSFFKKMILNPCFSFWLSRKKSIHFHYQVTCTEKKKEGKNPSLQILRKCVYLSHFCPLAAKEKTD